MFVCLFVSLFVSPNSSAAVFDSKLFAAISLQKLILRYFDLRYVCHMEHHPTVVRQCLAKVVCSNLSSKNEYLIVCLQATIFTGFFLAGGLMEVSMENQILID